MKLPLFPLAVGLFASSVATHAFDRLPLEDFSRQPEITRARLAPDGLHYAFLRSDGGPVRLHVATTDNKEIVRMRLNPAVLLENAPKEVTQFHWVSDHRLLVETSVWDLFYGVFATDRDGRHSVPISGYEDETFNYQARRSFAREVIHRFFDADQNVLMLDRHEEGGGGRNRPDILKVNTTTGLTKTVVPNTGGVGHWGVDFNGVARFGVLTHGDLSGAIYRDSETDEWKTILPLKDRRGEMRLTGFDAASGKILVTMLNEQKRWTIFPLDPHTGEIAGPLLSDPEYDVTPDGEIISSAGISLSTAIFSRRKQSLVGVRYYTESARVKWFDKEFAADQMAVDKALPQTVNVFIDESLDGKEALWFGFSDQNPGAYYLFDHAKHTFRLLAARMSWINPAQMAPMLSVKYTARDGLVIHGYLTVPLGHELKDLPLVVMRHGGPWVRDTWGFDPLVQLVANRGYGVLQMNYRGSPGYGEELSARAKRQVGGEIQADIEDATRWAISVGLADPRRIAIYGGSYGGYSALFALGKTPELYRCGISLAGVTDWPAIFNNSDVADYKMAKQHWREQIGDPSKDADMLRAISPVSFADKITAPVLIIQGKKDRRVPPDQARPALGPQKKTGHFFQDQLRRWG